MCVVCKVFDYFMLLQCRYKFASSVADSTADLCESSSNTFQGQTLRDMTYIHNTSGINHWKFGVAPTSHSHLCWYNTEQLHESNAPPERITVQNVPILAKQVVTIEYQRTDKFAGFVDLYFGNDTSPSVQMRTYKYSPYTLPFYDLVRIPQQYSKLPYVNIHFEFQNKLERTLVDKNDVIKKHQFVLFSITSC